MGRSYFQPPNWHRPPLQQPMGLRQVQDSLQTQAEANGLNPQERLGPREARSGIRRRAAARLALATAQAARSWCASYAPRADSGSRW